MTEAERLKFRQARVYLEFIDDWENLAILTDEQKRLRILSKSICKDLSPLVDIDTIVPPSNLFDV